MLFSNYQLKIYLDQKRNLKIIFLYYNFLKIIIQAVRIRYFWRQFNIKTFFWARYFD